MISLKHIPALPKSLQQNEAQILKQYSPGTACEIIVPLNSIRKVVKADGTIKQHLELDRLLFKGKIVAMFEYLNSKMNMFLTSKEQKIAKTTIEKDFHEFFAPEVNKIIQMPDGCIKDIEMELLNEGESEAKLFKKVLSSKACKRYVKTAQELEGPRLKIAMLEDDIAQIESQILELKKIYYKEQDIAAKNELAEKINLQIDSTKPLIQEYNRLLTQVYAPKVTSMKQDAKEIEKHLREVKKVEYSLPLEVFIGKTPKSPRDKNYSIIV